MRKLAPFIMIALAIVTGFFTFSGEGTYQRLMTARRSLARQEAHNMELSDTVRDLKHEVYGLNNSNRILEKAARNELGMARPDEMIIVFDHSKESDADGKSKTKGR
jgi:cell division protein FtsB